MFSIKNLFKIPNNSDDLKDSTKNISEIQLSETEQSDMSAVENQSTEVQSNTTKKSPEEKELYKKLLKLSRNGYKQIKHGELLEATASFEQILEIDNSNHYALVGMGDVYRKKRQYPQAVEFYQQCLKVQENNNYALFGLADCYRNMDSYDKAIKVWDEYLRYDNGNVTVLTRIADAYRRLNDLDNSMHVYQNVLEIEPENAYALTGLGHLHYGLHNYTDSLKYWLQIYHSKGFETDIRVLTSIGNCHRKLKEFLEGTSFFEEALKKEDSNFYALFGMADCYRGRRIPEQSIIYWNRILDIDPENKVILTRAGDAYRQQQELDQAESYYKRALNIKYDIYAVIGLAVINIYKDKHGDAVHQLERLLDRNPQILRAYPLLTECYAVLDNRSQAVDLYEKYSGFDSENPQISQQMDELKIKFGI